MDHRAHQIMAQAQQIIEDGGNVQRNEREQQVEQQSMQISGQAPLIEADIVGEWP